MGYFNNFTITDYPQSYFILKIREINSDALLIRLKWPFPIYAIQYNIIRRKWTLKTKESHIIKVLVGQEEVKRSNGGTTNVECTRFCPPINSTINRYVREVLLSPFCLHLGVKNCNLTPSENLETKSRFPRTRSRLCSMWLLYFYWEVCPYWALFQFGVLFVSWPDD